MSMEKHKILSVGIVTYFKERINIIPQFTQFRKRKKKKTFEM